MSRPPTGAPTGAPIPKSPYGFNSRPVPANALPLAISPHHARNPMAPMPAKAGSAVAAPAKSSNTAQTQKEPAIPFLPPTVTPTSQSRHLDKDMAIPEGVYLPEVDLYRRAVALESKMDYYLQRAQLRLSASNARPERRALTSPRILRFTVSNSHEGQPLVDGRPDPQATISGKEPGWSVRLSGRLLDSHGNVVTGTGTRKMSSFFKTIAVQLDRTEFPTQWNISWTRPPSSDDVDTFTFTQKSRRESIVNVYLFPITHPSQTETFSPAPILRQSLNLLLPRYTRKEMMLAFWRYIRDHSLQDPTRKSNVRCDETLRGLFDVDCFEYDNLAQLIQPYLFTSDPIHIPYQIRFCKDARDAEVVLDIPVEVDLHPHPHINLNANHAKIAEWNKFQTEHLDRIRTKKRKHDFYCDFASDPLFFMQEWLQSQHRDHAIISKPPQHGHQSSSQSKSSNSHSSSSSTPAETGRIDRLGTTYFNQLLAANAVHSLASSLPERVAQDVPYVNNAERDLTEDSEAP